MKLQSKYDISEFDSWIKSLSENRGFFYYLNISKIHFARRKGNKIIFSSHFTRGVATLNQSNNELYVKIRTLFSLKLFAFSPTLLTFPMLFSSNVTINGNSDPSFLSKLAVVAGAVIFTIVEMYILSWIKKEFVANAIKEFTKEDTNDASEKQTLIS